MEGLQRCDLISLSSTFTAATASSKVGQLGNSMGAVIAGLESSRARATCGLAHPTRWRDKNVCSEHEASRITTADCQN